MGECWNMEGGGTLSLEEEGLRVHLRAVCPDDGRGLYKVWVRGAGREPAPGDFDTGEWKAGAVQDSEPVHAGTGGLLAGNGREYCAGISLYRTIRRRGAVEARAGSGAAVQGSSAPGASPGADRLLQRAGGGGAPVGSPLFRSKGISAAGAVLSGPGGGTGGAALAGVAL